MKYDFFGEEWSGKCRACNTELFAPTKYDYLVAFNIHTHSDQCLGGY